MIKYQSDNKIKYGETIITTEENKEEKMLMDFSIFKGKKGDIKFFQENEKEIAIILFYGKLRIKWDKTEKIIERKNVFEFGPYVLHVSRKKIIEIEFLVEGEIGIQKTTNEKNFESKLYIPKDCKNNILGEKKLEGTAQRIVRDIFNYKNAPYSNMVLGEVITYPGRWSSYPPHSHEQPEIYFYKFTKDQGFGIGMVGEKAFKIKNNSALLIKGDKVHPQVAAPGYGMYYCWMIKNLKDNPWNKRIFEKEHEWLLEEM